MTKVIHMRWVLVSMLALILALGCKEKADHVSQAVNASALGLADMPQVRLEALRARGLEGEVAKLSQFGSALSHGLSEHEAQGAAVHLALLGFTVKRVASPECRASLLFQAAANYDRASADIADIARLSEVVGLARFVARRDNASLGDVFLGETELDMVENWGNFRPSKIVTRNASGMGEDGLAVSVSSSPEPVRPGVYVVFASRDLYVQSSHELGAVPKRSSAAPYVQLLYPVLPVDDSLREVLNGDTGTPVELQALKRDLIGSVGEASHCR